MKNNTPTKLEQARRAAGLTRKELSALTNVNDRTIEAYEQRKLNFNGCAVATALKIAKALNKNIEDLIEED